MPRSKEVITADIEGWIMLLLVAALYIVSGYMAVAIGEAIAKILTS